jgi:hypothetical protein
MSNLKRYGKSVALAVALLVVLGAAAHGAYGTYQLTVTTKNCDGSVANDCFVKFHNLSTSSSSIWRYTGINSNQVIFSRPGCSKYDSARIQVVKDTLVGNTKTGNLRYVICDSVESKTVKISSGFVLVATAQVYTEPCPYYAGGRNTFLSTISMTTDCEDSTQYAQTVRFSGHFDPGSLQVVGITPIPGGFYDTYSDWDNEEGWVTYECQSYDPNGEPIPTFQADAVELAQVEFDGTATLDPCSPLIFNSFDPLTGPGGRQTPPPSDVNGVLCPPTETHFPAFPPVSLLESPAGLTPMPVELDAARPNPFSSATTIEFTLKEGAETVVLSVLDASGRTLTTLASGAFDRGSHTVRWDGRSDLGTRVAEGVYFCHLEAGDHRISRKIILSR